MEKEAITLVPADDDQVATPAADVATPADAAADCAEEPNSATICTEGEGLSVCNCENDEEVTVFETDCEPDLNAMPAPVASDEEEAEAADAVDEACENAPACCCVDAVSQKLTRKCEELKSAIGDTASRIARDWKATGGNPYIKLTRTTQVDIYRSHEDTEPVDTFRTQRSNAFYARTLALTSAATFLVSATAESLIRNIFKKK